MTATANFTVSFQQQVLRSDFALWAQSYDEVPNPLLSLERRILSPMLPPLNGQDVLDVGCGTGRWVQHLARSAPRTLLGVDYSAEMLRCAQNKLGPEVSLAVAEAGSLPVPDCSTDVVIASFLLSYLADLPQFAHEVRRVLRGAGKVYVSDMHPATAASCNWDRGFRAGDRHVSLSTQTYSLEEVCCCWERAGFRMECLFEPAFGLLEREVFQSAGRLDAFQQAAGRPAIYVMQLGVRDDGEHSSRPASSAATPLCLIGARLALDAETSVSADLEVAVEVIARLGRSPSAPNSDRFELELDGCLLLPGLINAHDHLEFGLYPNLGSGPYSNSEQWALDIQLNQTATINKVQAVRKDVRLWWGAIRNLLCGVTTVCHHNPLHAELLNESFPVRVLTDFGWAHSLAMDEEAVAKFKATTEGQLFFMHAGEGVDDLSAGEIETLDHLGILDERTFLIHGLALTKEGIALLNRRRATLIWCPTSNRFLFGRTHTKEAISSIDRVLLGSDSPLTSAGDLLEEVRVAHRDIGVSSIDLYAMLLDRAAKLLRLRDGRGCIRPGGCADLVAVRGPSLAPGRKLVNLNNRSIELVMVAGRVKLVSDRLVHSLPAEARAGLEPLEVDSEIRWVRAPLRRMFDEIEAALGPEIMLAGKRVRYGNR